jgi:hypothetical protein
MRKFFLLMLILLLTLQPLVAAEAEFAHLMQGQHSGKETMQHVIEHINHVAHHHHQDGSSHQSKSSKSALHILACDCVCSLIMLPASEKVFTADSFADSAPVFTSELYQSHSPPPLTKPPLQAL